MAKVMVVDDSRTMCRMLSSLLSEMGHEVVATESNGEAAVEKLKTVQPDVVTLDITMPVMDGLTALALIKDNYPDIKVVMISAAGQKAKVTQAVKAGAVDFIHKPFNKDDVEKVFKNF